MLWLIIACALIIAFFGIIMLRLELFYLRKKSDYIWVLLEKEHIKLGELALKLTNVLKFHDVKKTKPYQNVFVCQQHLKNVKSIWEKFQVYRTMLCTLRKLIDITKDYPECRANHIYIQIIADINLLELTINQLCISYNNYTIKYNNAIRIVPQILAKLLKIREKNII